LNHVWFFLAIIAAGAIILLAHFSRFMADLIHPTNERLAMARIHATLLIFVVAVAPAFGQGKADAVPLAAALEQFEKKMHGLEGDLKDEISRLIQATEADTQAIATQGFEKRQHELRDAQSTLQKLMFLQNKLGKAGAAKKSLAAWIEMSEKINPKLPTPPPPPDEPPDFTAIDKHALGTPNSETKSLPQLAKYLTQTSRNDTQKARAVFMWIVNNIRYDLDGVKKGKETTRPDQVLISRATNCAGYSYLYESLANYAGLQTSTIQGWARIDLDNPMFGDPRGIQLPNGMGWGPHGWNAVKIGAKLHFIDPTWGVRQQYKDGKLIASKKPNFDYFLVPAETLAYTHRPDNPRWQQMKTPLGKAEQETLPRVRPAFFRLGLKIGNALQPVVVIRDTVLITLEAPKDVVLDTVIFAGKSQSDGKRATVQVDGKSIEIRAAFTERGVYQLHIFARKKTDDDTDPDQVLSYSILVQESNKYAALPTLERDFQEKGAVLHYPWTERVTADMPQLFALTIPNAMDVSVRTGGKNYPLQKRGDHFVGEVTISQGDVTVEATFASQSHLNLVRFVAK
jgi:transglutaminase superfamily protein